MSKTSAFLIAALTLCAGLLIGVMATSSEVSAWKIEKKEAVKAKKDALEKLETFRANAKSTQNLLNSRLAKAEKTEQRMKDELSTLRIRQGSHSNTVDNLRNEINKLKTQVKFLSNSPEIIHANQVIAKTLSLKKDETCVKYVDHKIEHKNNGILSEVHVYLRFKNNTHKTLTGLVYTIEYFDDFGDTLHKTDPVKDAMKIPAGGMNDHDGFHWVYSKQIFLKSSYDKLKAAADAGTTRVRVNIMKASFSDGSVIDFL